MPTATRTFRVFVSSTFEDLIDERNVLQEKVLPGLEKFCLEKGAHATWQERFFSGPALDAHTREILRPFVEWAKGLA
jgi:hypothetical protein